MLYTFRQDSQSHMFYILEDERQIDCCDLITAEELATYLTDSGQRVQWEYPEDFSQAGVYGKIKQEV